MLIRSSFRLNLTLLLSLTKKVCSYRQPKFGLASSSRGKIVPDSEWEFEARWTRFPGLSKGGNLWVRHSPKLRREVRFVRDVDYWHWLLIEAEPDIAMFCEEPVRSRQRPISDFAPGKLRKDLAATQRTNKQLRLITCLTR